MDAEYVMRRLVGSYIPGDATTLPFLEQRGIIHEITGYTVSIPEVASRYLESPHLGVLVDDAGVAAVMRQELARENYVLPGDDDLRDYLEHRDNAVLARVEANWPVLQDRYPDSLLNLLLRAGTNTALLHFEAVAGRELEPEEAELAFMAALQTGDFEALNHIDHFEVILDYDSPESRQQILSLSSRQVANAVAYERQGHNDFTVFILPTYYLEREVAAALYFLGQWDSRGRSILVAQLLGWSDVTFDVNHPLIQAYVQQFPEDEAAQELAIGGEPGLRQVLEPNFNNDYARSRGPRYQAEKRYILLRRYQGPLISPLEVEDARRAVNAYRRAAGEQELLDGE
jgi:hypothetical protein